MGASKKNKLTIIKIDYLFVLGGDMKEWMEKDRKEKYRKQKLYKYRKPEAMKMRVD